MLYDAVSLLEEIPNQDVYNLKKIFFKHVRVRPNFVFAKNRECIQITSILSKLANLGGRGENVIAFEENTYFRFVLTRAHTKPI